MNRTRKKIQRPPNPYSTANIFSRWSFWWIKDLFRQGLKGALRNEDLYQHRSYLDSERITNKFAALWEIERRTRKPSVLRLIMRAYGKLYLPLHILYAAFDSAARIVKPLLLGKFVSYFVEGQTSVSQTDAYWYAAGLVLSLLIPILMFHPFIFCTLQVGTNIRLGFSGLVYRKCLQISKTDSSDGLRGRVVNILASDLGKLDDMFHDIHDLWKGPIDTIIIGYLMYRQIGISAVIGLAFVLGSIPLVVWAARRSAHYQEKTAERADVRIKLMNEIIQGIQVIKMYAWEKTFSKVIAAVRLKEARAIRGLNFMQAIFSCTDMISPISLFVAFISYIYMGNVLTAQLVYTVSAFSVELCESMVFFWPMTLAMIAEARVSAKRTEQFLCIGEEPLNYGKSAASVGKESRSDSSCNKSEPACRRVYKPEAENKMVVVRHATANWTDESGRKTSAIADFNTEIQGNTLTAVVGPVGAGKSTFLNVLLGEISVDEGEVLVHGKLSYAAQDAWVFEGTIRDNIIFVEDYNERRYKRVLNVCALERDLEGLPSGDLTIVGERGMRLSGGQKARINLARAVYRKADIYLFDDPLSAVDAHVGKHIFENCISQFLSNKIRILVTHQLQYLFDVQKLILINSGHIAAQGSYQDLEKTQQFKFFANAIEEKNTVKTEKYKRSDSETSNDSSDQRSSLLGEDEQPAEDQNAEGQGEGSVKLDVYKAYFKALKSPIAVLAVGCLFIGARVLTSGVDYFLSRWVIWEEKVALDPLQAAKMTEEEEAAKRRELVVTYAIMLVATLAVYLMRSFGFYRMCFSISLKLHNELFRGITRARMYFFNTNSSGRILNRFAKDIRGVDRRIPSTLYDCINFIVDVFGIFTIVGIANFWLLPPALLVIGCLLLLRHVYLSTSRSVQRIESLLRSPTYTLTNETFQGLTTIRALEATRFVEKEFHDYQNANTSAWFIFLGCTRAFALWSDLLCFLYAAGTVFSFLLFKSSFSSGDVGLAILYSTHLVGLIQWGLRQTAELENQMTCVERILEYAEQPSEPPCETPEELKPKEPWPSNGRIEFRDISLRYSLKDPFVLSKLNFSVQSEEKIGIVGRTGAGKSSIIQSLFRLAYSEGVIEIDGIDIETLGLHDLRSKISIIPQDPVLFSGTLRYNLDPFESQTDEVLWKALRNVELGNYVLSLPGGLSDRVYDGGSNFSVGQRQLICLARALLRNNKILILDEATASVDPETDQLIQKTIRDKFAKCTVLTIAHRLDTVIDYDRILVMEAGRAVEFSSPYELLQNPSGHLRQLVDQTGSAARFLYRTAESSYNRKSSKAKSQ